MEFKMDSKIVEIAAKAPLMFVNASLGEDEEYNRDPGIQLTKEQIIGLRKYEVLGLSLPVRLEDVVAYYNKGGTPNDQLDEEIFPLSLTPQELADLVTFLKEGLSSKIPPSDKAPELPN